MANFNLMSYLLPPEDKLFYDLFERSTGVCKEASCLLNEILKNSVSEEALIKAKELKKESSSILRQTLKELNKTFVTPLEPEDIQKIITLLNKITKKIVRVCVNLKVYHIDNFNQNMINQSEELLKATVELEYIIKKFKKSSSMKKITAGNFRMKKIEMRGDEIINSAMENLFSGEFEALDVIKFKDIYKDLEVAVDSCYAVSDEVMNIVLRQG